MQQKNTAAEKPQKRCRAGCSVLRRNWSIQQAGFVCFWFRIVSMIAAWWLLAAVDHLTSVFRLWLEAHTDLVKEKEKKKDWLASSGRPSNQVSHNLWERGYWPRPCSPRLWSLSSLSLSGWMDHRQWVSVSICPVIRPPLPGGNGSAVIWVQTSRPTHCYLLPTTTPTPTCVSGNIYIYMYVCQCVCAQLGFFQSEKSDLSGLTIQASSPHTHTHTYTQIFSIPNTHKHCNEFTNT